MPISCRTSTSPRPSVIQLAIKEKAALYAAYIPLFSEGGIFIPTAREYKLGDDIYVLLSLLDDPQRYPVAGKVSWMQLEPTDQLELLADMATYCGAAAGEASQILAGKRLSDVQLLRNIGIQATPTSVPAFAVGTNGRLLCAIHRVDNRAHASVGSYKTWLTTANRRTEVHST